ncbi:MAG: class I SAM-dependent rRNA methyltransferase [Verrucomicrobiaceae bacterium]|nr:class I SAM-dependent rRNA methyltransferase [Verrucomicrobiaceae bacterium]
MAGLQPTVTVKKRFPAPSPDTTAWRIFHDAASEVWVDHFDGRWLVQTREPDFPGFVTQLAEGVADSIYWRPRDKAAATAPVLVAGESVAERFAVRENGASFWIDFRAGYSCGIFLDQRLNRRWVGEIARPGQRVLNTFAYTGGFSVMAALAGATTTTVDLSGTYLDWTWENFTLNGLDPAAHHGVKGDAFNWLRTFARQGRTFHGIVLDPPTFSRKAKGTFRSERDYADLAALAAALIEPGGWILCCANTHGLTSERFERDVLRGIRSRRRRVLSREDPGMPPEFRGDEYLKSLRLVVE